MPELFADNADAPFSTAELQKMMYLRVGETMILGGGAGAEAVLRREPARYNDRPGMSGLRGFHW